MTNQLVAGDIVVCYQGWAYQNSLAAGAGNKTVKTKTPKEGAFSFCDLYAIPSTSDNVDTVARLDQRGARPAARTPRIAEYLVAAVTVEASATEINAATKALYPYDDLELGDSTGERLAKLFELAPFYGMPPSESDEYITFSEMSGEVGGDQAGRVSPRPRRARVTDARRITAVPRGRPRLRLGAGRPRSACRQRGCSLFFVAPLLVFFVYSFLTAALYDGQRARSRSRRTGTRSRPTSIGTLALNSLVVGLCAAAATVVDRAPDRLLAPLRAPAAGRCSCSS